MASSSSETGGRDIGRAAIPHTGRGRRVAILIGAFVLVVAVLWVVARGFHGRQIRRNAAALTTPVVQAR